MTGVLTAVLSYFGYVQVAENASPTIDVEINQPDAHSHPQKDWAPYIKQEIEKARKQHSNAHHGGD